MFLFLQVNLIYRKCSAGEGVVVVVVYVIASIFRSYSVYIETFYFKGTHPDTHTQITVLCSFKNAYYLG